MPLLLFQIGSSKVATAGAGATRVRRLVAFLLIQLSSDAQSIKIGENEKCVVIFSTGKHMRVALEVQGVRTVAIHI